MGRVEWYGELSASIVLSGESGMPLGACMFVFACLCDHGYIKKNSLCLKRENIKRKQYMSWQQNCSRKRNTYKKRTLEKERGNKRETWHMKERERERDIVGKAESEMCIARCVSVEVYVVWVWVEGCSGKCMELSVGECMRWTNTGRGGVWCVWEEVKRPGEGMRCRVTRCRGPGVGTGGRAGRSSGTMGID